MNNLLKHPIISAVIAGLILSFLAWLAGFLPSTWQWIKNAGNTIYSVVSYDITLPLWLMVLISIPLLKWTYHIVTRHQGTHVETKKDSLNHEESTTRVVTIKLTEDEQRVMRQLVSADGKAVKPDHIRYHTGLPNLKIDQILEALAEKKLIDISNNAFNGTSIWLTREGRDLMIGNEYSSA